MEQTAPWYQELALSVLLRAARRPFTDAIRKALALADCEDLPKNGAFMLGAIANTNAPLGRIAHDLDVSKQAVGQLADTLVLRGYLERTVDAEDRRRLTLTLTERGMAANIAIRHAIQDVQGRLAAEVAPEHLAITRKTLAALALLDREESV